MIILIPHQSFSSQIKTLYSCSQQLPGLKMSYSQVKGWINSQSFHYLLEGRVQQLMQAQPSQAGFFITLFGRSTLSTEKGISRRKIWTTKTSRTLQGPWDPNHWNILTSYDIAPGRQTVGRFISHLFSS